MTSELRCARDYSCFIFFNMENLNDLEGEIWKDIEDFEGLYQISNYGRVKSFPRHVGNGRARRMLTKRILAPAVNRNGYYNVVLSNNAINKTKSVHRLIAIAFIPNPENKPFINHIDGIKTNNDISNLEWVTCSENHKHAYDVLNRKRNQPQLGKKGAKCHASIVRYLYNLEGELIREFESARDAAIYLKLNKSSIYRYIKEKTIINNKFIVTSSKTLNHAN